MSEPREPTRDVSDDAVTDEELMQFFDGEFDGEREEQIANWIECHQDARDKLIGLDIIGDVLREQAAADERGDVADDVMTAIDDGTADSDSAVGADVIKLPRNDLESVAPAAGKAANDNSRTIYALAGIAAAVAAGMFLWGRAATTTGPLADLAPPGTEAPAVIKVLDEPPAPPSADPVAEAQDNSPVEVAAVDWGNQMGQVFEVGESGAVVVWVNDSAGEEEL